MILELRQLYLEVILLRGGIWNVEFKNLAVTDLDVKIKVFLLTSVNRPDFAFEPTTAPNLWDPTASPDFINFIGKPYKHGNRVRTRKQLADWRKVEATES